MELVFQVLGSALSIWDSKEKTKFQDKYIALKKEFYEEFNKEVHDNARLDNIEFNIKLLCDSFAFAVTTKSNT